MAYIYDIADTWNAIGTTFNGIKLNVTNTASAGGSMLIDLQIGGVSQFNVRKDGYANATGGFTFGSPSGNVNVALATAGGVSGISLASTLGIGWTSGAQAFGSPDLFLARDAANTLAQRNSTNPQAFNLYNGYTDAANYSRASMYFSGGAFFIDNDLNAGSGITNASLWIKSRGTVYLSPGAGGYDVVTNNNGAGSLYPGGTTNTTNLGRSDKAFALGYFGTAAIIGGYVQVTEMTAPAAPATNNVRIYAEDNGAGKTRLMALFPTGVAQQIAIEP